MPFGPKSAQPGLRRLCWLLLIPLCLTRPAAAEQHMVQFKFDHAPLQLIIDQLNQASEVTYHLDESIDERVTLASQPLTPHQAVELLKRRYKLVEVERNGELWLQRRPPAALNQPAVGQTELEPRNLHVYQPRNYNPSELLRLLDPQLGGLLTRPSRVLEERVHNQLLVQATSEEHAQIARLLKNLDYPQPVVRVYSRIVVARKQAQRELGARLGLQGNTGELSIAGGANGAIARLPDFGDRLAVDFGLIGSGAQLALGQNGSAGLIELELQALDSSGLVDIVASPQVLVTSGQKAFIATGTQVPYLQRNSDGDTEVLFKDALLSLEVTPIVEAEQRIDMTIEFAMDTLGASYNGVPSINTNRLDTRVKTSPGRTLILGGIYSQVASTSKRKVPVLGDLPLVGWLFRYTNKQLEEAELLVFLTPQLLEPTDR